MSLKLAVAGLLLAAALPISGQVAPAAEGGSLPLSVGLAYSEYSSDFNGEGSLSGPNLWIDWRLYRPSYLDGFGLELEGRDLNYGRTGGDPKLRQDTVEAGVIYHWRRFLRVQPYGKFLVGLGSMDFSNSYDPTYTHDTKKLIVPGGGVEVKLAERLRVRGDYEYQFWVPDFFGLRPQGVSLGMSYDFGVPLVHQHFNP
jgi:opacity protein-like surface antigen